MMGRLIGTHCLTAFRLGVVASVVSSFAHADLVISSVDSPVTITFDETLAGVNQNRFLGEGLSPSPTFGQLDSDSWEIDTGTATLPFGDTSDPPSSLFAGGDPQGPVTVGGLYSFNPSGVNRALGVQPHDDHFTPGTITLRVLNNTGAEISLWNVAYEIFAFNDKLQSTSMDFSYATGMETPGAFVLVPSLDFDSMSTPDGAWTAAIPRSTLLSASVAAGGHLFLRWTINTSSEEGDASLHDEIALDTIQVIAASVPEPSAFLFGAIVAGIAGLVTVGQRRADRSRLRP
jgi:hypothetical protein